MGKHKYIETPERMWELFNEYKKATKAKPILVQDYVGKDGNEVFREKERPLTMEGFSIYLYEQGLICDIWQYFSNLNDAYKDYLGICRTIREAIRLDQIEGGMAGIYNPSITQRLNGLTEKTETKLTMEQPLFPDVQENNSNK